MTAVDEGSAATPAPAGTPAAPRAPRVDPLSLLPRPARVAAIAALVVLVVSLAELLTDETRLTSANTWSSALQLTIPIALAGLGGLWSERAGVVNIGLEGMLILGTWMGAWGCIEHGPWAGVAIGVLGGALGGGVHAVATIGFNVDHIVSGVAVNILAVGATQFVNLEVFDSTNSSPRIPANVATISIPGLNDVVGGVAGDLTDTSVLIWLVVSLVALGAAAMWFRPAAGLDAPLLRRSLRPAVLGALGTVATLSLVELAPYLADQQRFFVSELGRIVMGLTDDVSLIVVLGVAAFPLSAFVLYRTKFGLRLRSVGEDPVAAESLGIDVYRMKVTAVILSGAFAGLGGVSLVYLFAQRFQTGQTNGRGYIGLAAMIFGNWMPGGLALGAGLFGFTDALSLQTGETTHSLLVVVAIGAGLMVLRALYLRRWRGVVTAGVAGLATYAWFRATDELPGEIVVFLPHLTTLLVLTFASQRLRPPAADGQPYRRGGTDR